jgi:hypothetical protein
MQYLTEFNGKQSPAETAEFSQCPHNNNKGGNFAIVNNK